ncbi:negative elongation factor A [Callorhinchus milii]|uniref:Negative elongation factor complex member A n=1 Tax=Callorhinchus milii TaxID=7868 RepID=A0A4W3HEZ5_CALMI|nr:negative elongation factor A [Callorhinchus milii]|eukprot:gi/632964799/ref/XP_007898573.1/ PREDICTED: negative elongation factor A [Callorhinchus milii]
MASMRESDTGLWLHNKLGSADELWAPPSIASLLTKDVVDNIRVCFHGLSSAVKLKLLLGILHLPRRTVDEMKASLTEIVHLAAMDTDSWVQMVADILKTFPETGSLNLELEEHNQNLQEILGELREKVNECEASAMLPLECQYLNKNALTTLVGPLTPPVKHFQLKRKPKSATLRAELLQKSTETAQQLKKTSGVPFLAKGRGLVKKIDTTTPLKGIPKQAPFRSPTTPSVFSPSTNRTPMAGRTPLRKERGVKLLDISELDMVGAGREAKRRRKTLDADVAEKPAKEETVLDSVTPDYAVGLVSTQKLGALNNDNPLPSTSYLPATPSMVPSSSYIPSSETPQANTGGSVREALQTNRLSEESTAPTSGLPGQFKQRTPIFNSSSTASTTSATTTTPASASVTTTAQTPPAQQQTQQQQQQQTPQQQPQAQQQQQQAQPPPQQTQQQQQPRRNLSLTRDQMYAAQEMFKTANKVTRPEKALILGFMAGSRENPCPEQGDIIQIKLSEHTELLPKADGTGSTTMLVDTVFEMNYATGQWTRLKKYKPITNVS